MRDMTLIVKLITSKSNDISKMILRVCVIKKLKNNAPNRL